VRPLRKVLASAVLCALAALVLAGVAQAAPVANPGPVTVTAISAPVSGTSLAGLGAPGSVDAAGNLVFPTAGVAFPAISVPPTSGEPSITGGTLTLTPTNDVTGTIDPATGAVSLLGRATGVVHVTGSAFTIPLTADCNIGSVADPIRLPLGSAPLVPAGPDLPVPYDQATGTATLVGRIDLPTVSGSDCTIGGSTLGSVLNAFAGFIVPSIEGNFANQPVVASTRFSPALHAPGFGSGFGGPAAVIAGPPSNLFQIGKAKLSPPWGVKFGVTLPGAGALKVVETAKKSVVAKADRTTTQATKLTLTLKPSKAEKRRLRHQKRLLTTVKFTYTPTGGQARSTSRKVTLRLKRPGR
jgi:hypothetical protein